MERNNEHQSHSHALQRGGSSQQLGAPSLQARQAEPAAEARVNFSDVWDTLREGKWIILLTCILVTLAITAYTLTLTPVYESSSIVSVDTRSQLPSNVITIDEGQSLANEVGMLRFSAVLATRVAEGLKATAEAVEADDYFPILLDEEGELVSDRQVAAALQERVSFRQIEMQNLIQIAAESPVPEEAASIANLYATEYEKYSQERRRAGVTAQREYLEEQVERRGQELNEIENQWEAFARNNDVVTEGVDGQRVAQEYAGLETQKRELQFELERAEESLRMLKDQIRQFEPELREQTLAERSTSELQTQIAAYETRIADLRAQAAPFYINYPDLEGDETRIAEEFPQLAEINRQIEGFTEQKDRLTEELIEEQAKSAAVTGEAGAVSRVAQIRSRITDQEMTISQLNAQIRALDGQLGQYGGRLQGIPRQTIERTQIERRREQAERFYNTFREELQRVKIAEESELGYVDQVQRAFVPLEPVSPDIRQNVLLGLLLGLGFGTGLAFVRRATSNRFRKPEDVQDKGYSLIGVVPKMDREVKASFEGRETVEVEGRSVSTRLMPLLNPWSPISENYRLMRTNLQHARNGAAPRVILMTSPEPSDGKTLTAVNLAITMAQSGRRTLLIDADLRRPAAHKLLDASLSPGLAGMLRREGAELQSVVQTTEVEGLHFLAAGRPEAPPAEVLGSERMERLVHRFRDTYDAVIIDSPPVLAVTDPLLLATLCDATLVVVSADRTQSEALRVTEKTLAAVGVAISGVIFNRFDVEKTTGYGYGYYGGKYYNDYAPTATA